MKRKILLLGITLAAILLIGWGVTSQTQLLKCHSDSLSNINYLLIAKTSVFKRGDIVYLKGHRTQYVKPNKSLAKRAVGLPGDQIQHDKHSIKLIPKDRNLTHIILPLLTTTSKGESLTPLSHINIPDGFVFVAGNHPKSFDSRYEEFGLVLAEKIKGRALWWW